MFLRRITLGCAVVVASASSLEVLLDDAGTHIRPGAAWMNAEGDCAQAGHGGGFHHNNGVHNSEAFAVWNFSISRDGCYWVEEFHPRTAGCDFSLGIVPVHIHFCKGRHTAGLVDQSQNAGQWNKLVRLPFYTSHTAAIHLSAKGLGYEATGVWAADAFRLTWDAESCHHDDVEPDEAVAPPAEADVAERVATPTETPEADMPTVEQEVDKEDETKVAVALQESFALTQSSGATYRVHTTRGFLNIHSEAGDPFRLDNVVGRWHDGDTFEAIGDMETVHGPWVQSERGWSIAKYGGFEWLERIKEKEATLPLLQGVVDDVDATVLGSTLEPVSQCPVTADKTFHHDGLQKGRRAQATFNFDPPHDGCYLVEEMHPQLDQCRASSNTKVHVNYCKGLQASGTLDQAANAGQWTFVAALPFYAGHMGNVTLSNEGTEPDTLAVFDKIRFTWSGKSCSKVDSHPRQAEIRLTVDFQRIANRHSEFGNALKAKLAALASVPEKSLRLTGLRPGSIIAQFLVLPSVVDGPITIGLSAEQIVERLRSAVAKSTAELCTLTGDSVEGCNVEFKDHGIATPSVRPLAKQQTQQQQQQKEQEKGEEGSHVTIIALCASVGLLSIFILVGFVITRFRKANRKVPASINEAKSTEVTDSMEEGKVVEDQKVEDVSDTQSTDCPSSDKQSEPSVSGDVDAVADENGSNPDTWQSSQR